MERRVLDEERFHYTLRLAVETGDCAPVVREGMKAFADRDRPHRKGYGSDSFAATIETMHSSQATSLKSAARVLQTAGADHGVNAPAENTIYREGRGLTEDRMRDLTSQIMVDIISLHAKTVKAPVDFIMDEFLETTTSKGPHDRANRPLTESGRRVRPTKQYIEMLKHMKDKNLAFDPFLHQGTRGHEQMGLLASLADGTTYWVQAYQTQPPPVAAESYVKLAAPVLRQLHARGVPLGDFLLDARWDSRAAVEELQALEDVTDWILKIQGTGQGVDVTNRLSRRTQRRRLDGRVPLNRRQLAEKLWNDPKALVEIPGKGGCLVGCINAQPYQQSKLQATLVVLFAPAANVKPTDTLRFGHNVRLKFYLTSRPASHETAVYVANKYGDRWLVEEAIRTFKQHRRKGGGKVMWTRALALQTSIVLQGIAKFVHRFRTRMLDKRKGVFERYTFNAMLNQVTHALHQAFIDAGNGPPDAGGT